MLSMQYVVNNPRIILSKQEYHVIILATVVYIRSCHFSMFQTWIQAMTCNTANDNRLSIQNANSNITNSNKTISIALLTRTLFVQYLTNSHVC